jgi:glycosyltransferase involved in cell wall biosynthesis
MKRISIVIPCHNEVASIPALFEHLRTLEAIDAGAELEWVFVNDGSTDGSMDALLEQQRTLPADRVVLVELSRNFGKEAALSAGLAIASGDAVIPMDADLQDPPELIPRMIEMWKGGADVVLARRTDRSHDSWFKRTSAALFYRVQNALSDVRLPENVGDFRLMDRAVVDVINALPESRRFMKGLFAWAGFRSAMLEYSRPQRSAGHTHFGTWRLAQLALEGVTGFSLAPLRIATILGVTVALISLVKGGWIAARTVLFGVDVPGYASIFSAVVFLGGLQLMCLGIIGEYLGRTYLETKRRPAYVIRKVYRNGAGG